MPETYQPVPVNPTSAHLTVPSSLASNVVLGGVVAVTSLDADCLIRTQSGGDIIRRIPATSVEHALGDGYECFNARFGDGCFIDFAGGAEGQLVFMVQFYD